MVDKKYTYSEIFHSIQGEGHYTGVPTAWIRFFLCNLQCDGFGQKFPTKPDTYELPYADFDAHSVDRVEDLPVWEKGCDSSYTWSKKFKHLMGQATGAELAQKIVDIMKNEHNPEGFFRHPLSGQHNHLCITGGELNLFSSTGGLSILRLLSYIRVCFALGPIAVSAGLGIAPVFIAAASSLYGL